MDSREKIAKVVGFPGCCGVTLIKNINSKVLKSHFTKFLKEENDNYCLGGLATAVSKVGDLELEKTLKEFSFKLLFKAGNENIWYRRLRFGSSYW